jgi:hypothetical protein
LERIIVPDLKLLESGLAIPCLDSINTKFVGSLYAVLGDDIGQREMAGFLYPQATYSSR